MCQRSASTARPSSIAPRIPPSMSSVCLARATRGCLNSGTPFAIASTPVSALHPAEKAFSSSSTLTASSRVRGQQGTARLGGVQRQRVDQADDDDDQQPDDEQHRGQQERARGISQAAQVEQRDYGQDAQADRHGLRGQAGEGRGQRRYPGGDGDRDGQRVVDDQRSGGQQAAPRPEVGPRHRICAPTARVSVDHLAVGEHQDGQQHHDHDRDRQDQVQRPRPGYRQDRDDRFRPVGHRRQGIQRQRRQTLSRGDLLPGHIPRPQRGPDQKPPHHPPGWPPA